MPNVKGLDPAPSLLAAMGDGDVMAYGPHAKVTRTGTLLTLSDKDGTTVATVDFVAPGGTMKPKVQAKLARINGDTVTAVNALLKPYGRCKVYWRTGEYRWLPVNGAPSPVRGLPATAPAAPAIPAPVTVAPAPVVVTPAPAASVPATPALGPSATLAAMSAVSLTNIPTMLRWQDRRKKQPSVKQASKSYSVVDDIFVPSVEVRKLDSMKRVRDAGHPAFGLFTGPAGTAKTSLAVAWAFANDLPVVVVEGQSIQTAGDWFGAIIPTPDGSTPFTWVWSDAAKLIMTGEPCLIVLDELNRPENERALNGVMGLTDWRGVVSPNGAPHAIRLMPGQCIIATLNEGVEYVGTVEVDAAVRDRFDAAGVVMDYPAKAIESRILIGQTGLDKVTADKLVRMAAAQRAQRDEDAFPSHNTLSPRALVTIGRNIVVGGMDVKEAVWSTAKTRFIREDWEALGLLIEAQFGPDAIDTGLDDEDEIEAMIAAGTF